MTAHKPLHPIAVVWRNVHEPTFSPNFAGRTKKVNYPWIRKVPVR